MNKFIWVIGSFSDIKQMIEHLKFMCVRLRTEFGLNHGNVLFPQKMNHKISFRRGMIVDSESDKISFSGFDSKS